MREKKQVGPRKWMSLQVFLFGVVATLQVLLKNRTGFLVSRLALGFAEAGYIPGAVYTLSTWYVRRELAKRVAVLFFGMFGGNAISPLLASGILKLEGRHGLRGWQWVFMCETCKVPRADSRLTAMTSGGHPDHMHRPCPVLLPPWIS